MDEDLDPDDGNANSVLAQEFSELLSILRAQSESVITKLGQTVPSDNMWLKRQATTDCAATSNNLKAMLDYFRQASPIECSNFLQRVCILCEDIPMHLESKLMSVAGYACSKYEIVLYSHYFWIDKLSFFNLQS